MVGHSRHAAKTRLLDETDMQRLVRLCGRLSGSYDAADDLAQETLLEAWRQLEKLEDPEGYWQWLTAIARNVCFRWGRAQGREALRQSLDGQGLQGNQVDQLADETDLELDLERQELITFLDRALALLPPETRAVLVDKYVEDFPQSAIAERLRLTEGAVEARLQRGKVRLRRLLSTDMREEAESLGILVPEEPYWHETRIWCPFCARSHLLARIDHTVGLLHYRCSGECTPSGTIVGGMDDRIVNRRGDLKSPKAILTRALLSLHDHYQEASAAGGTRCSQCGHDLPLEQQPSETWGYAPAIRMVCHACGAADNASLWHLALDTPAAQRFWRRHPRMLALPTKTVEHAGSQVVLGGFESVDGFATLRVMFDPTNYRVLQTAGDQC